MQASNLVSCCLTKRSHPTGKEAPVLCLAYKTLFSHPLPPRLCRRLPQRQLMLHCRLLGRQRCFS